MTRARLSELLLVLVLLLLVPPVSAQDGDDYDLDWWTVDGGGGQSSGGDYRIDGTVGQPDAGQMSGGSFAVDGGYWPGVCAMGAFTAAAIAFNSGDVTLSWADVSGATSYTVYRSPGDPYVTAASAHEANITSPWTDSGVGTANIFYLLQAEGCAPAAVRLGVFHFDLTPGS